MKKRRVRPEIFVLLASLCITLVVLELAARTVFAGDVDQSMLNAKFERTPGMGREFKPSEVPGLYYELRSNLNVDYGSYVLNTDAAGFRSGAPESPQGVKVAIIGDSSSFGWRVKVEDTYPVLGNRSFTDALGAPVSIRNFSVPGYNSRQEQIVFQRSVLPENPAILIVHHDFNDAEATGLGIPADYIAPSIGDNIFGSALIKLVVRRYTTFQNAKQQRRWDDPSTKRFGEYSNGGPLYDDQIAALRNIARIAREHGILPVLVVFDAYVEKSASPEQDPRYAALYAPLLSGLDGAGFVVINLYPDYQEKMRQEGWSDFKPLWVAPDDGHPNPAGHQFLAETIARELAKYPEVRSALTKR
jgi:lysophospholipase L1-like esterase